ncbi:hypothetical protein M3P05_03055 [Sansalvadorimonas sp. 2012CJ34-2]|uniref:Uncharacterized protein n=1 Tax=Parendozoicomonas callyspongiae TaxID=2942213 RepID=A0ABT0PC82_9GAMM|nr:hypothetical protein [Sansalvadorimonas sp. 2012CJ34-2]MCL6268930.1 hypothetical protein [Sansalvadorimonas sp. 2012CJ34-2]
MLFRFSLLLLMVSMCGKLSANILSDDFPYGKPIVFKWPVQETSTRVGNGSVYKVEWKSLSLTFWAPNENKFDVSWLREGFEQGVVQVDLSVVPKVSDVQEANKKILKVVDRDVYYSEKPEGPVFVAVDNECSDLNTLFALVQALLLIFSSSGEEDKVRDFIGRAQIHQWYSGGYLLIAPPEGTDIALGAKEQIEAVSISIADNFSAEPQVMPRYSASRNFASYDLSILVHFKTGNIFKTRTFTLHVDDRIPGLLRLVKEKNWSKKDEVRDGVRDESESRPPSPSLLSNLTSLFCCHDLCRDSRSASQPTERTPLIHEEQPHYGNSLGVQGTAEFTPAKK